MCCLVKLPRNFASILGGRAQSSVGPLSKSQSQSQQEQEQERQQHLDGRESDETATCRRKSRQLSSRSESRRMDSSESESPLTVLETSSPDDKTSKGRSQQEASLSMGDSERDEEREPARVGELGQETRSRQSEVSLSSRQTGEQQVGEPNEALRRRSIVQSGESGREIEVMGRRASVSSREFQRQQEREGANEMPTQRRAGLTRQSASAAVQEDGEGRGADVSSSGLSRRQSQASKGEESLEQGADQEDNTGAGGISRQESVSTTHSQGSQRDFSDTATQTAPKATRGSRRRSSRRSSSRRLSEQGPGLTDEGSDRRDDTGESKVPDFDADRELAGRRRASRSQPPSQRQMNRTPSKLNQKQTEQLDNSTTRRAISVSPSVSSSVNIRQILENVAQVEGPFQEPQLAFKVAIHALEGPCWSTKVEGILALIRLVTHHEQIVLAHLHEVVARVSLETRNLRSTVARSAIYALGDFCAKLGRSIEPETDHIVQALLQRSTENTAFIRDDIKRSFTIMVDNLTQWRLANALINHGAEHKNMHVRRMTSQFVALLVEKMGPAKCLVGARDIGGLLIPAAAKFAQDSSPHTRYYGRLILARIMQHSAFERLSRKYLTPNLYRNTIGIIESVKRRGPGDPPVDN